MSETRVVYVLLSRGFNPFVDGVFATRKAAEEFQASDDKYEYDVIDETGFYA